MARIVRATKGFRELGEAMRGLSRQVNQSMANKAVGRGAQLVKRAVIANAPVAKEGHIVDGVEVPIGTVKSHVVVKKIKSELTSEYIVTVLAGRKNAYARRIASMQEFGTVNQSPKSFVRKGFDQQKSNAIEIIKRVLNREITKASQ